MMNVAAKNDEDTTEAPKKRGRRKRVVTKEQLEGGGTNARSKAMYRRWQRNWVKPTFALKRTEAADLLLKYLRSRPGREALQTVVTDGFKGVDHLPDDKLAKFLEEANLLSRYPHTVEIK